MYLEFAGLPGSGKTTLSSALTSHLRTVRGGKVYSRDEGVVKSLKRRNDGWIKNLVKKLPSRFWWPLMGVPFALPEFVKISSPRLEFISFVSNILATSNMEPALIESIWNTIIRSSCEVNLVSQHVYNDELVIMDEAFAQRCFTLFGYIESKLPDNVITRYATLAPLANHIFWITTRPETCIERLKIRYKNKPSPYELNSKDLLHNFEVGNRALNCLADTLENQGKQVHRINGENDINSSILEICRISPKN